MFAEFRQAGGVPGMGCYLGGPLECGSSHKRLVCLKTFKDPHAAVSSTVCRDIPIRSLHREWMDQSQNPAQ